MFSLTGHPIDGQMEHLIKALGLTTTIIFKIWAH